MMTPDEAARVVRYALDHGTINAYKHVTDAVRALLAGYTAAVRDWSEAAEASGSFDSCNACTHRKYDETDGAYCDIKSCHPKWRGPCAANSPEPGGEE